MDRLEGLKRKLNDIVERDDTWDLMEMELTENLKNILLRLSARNDSHAVATTMIRNGATNLEEAARIAIDTKSMKVLLVLVKFMNKEWLLNLVAERGITFHAKLLMNSGAEPSKETLISAIRGGDSSMVKLFKEYEDDEAIELAILLGNKYVCNVLQCNLENVKI